MILAAERAGAAETLRAELARSRPELLAMARLQMPRAFPRAYRWVAEMREIALIRRRGRHGRDLRGHRAT